MAILAINEALEAAALLAEKQKQVDVAARIRSLKWSKSEMSIPQAGVVGCCVTGRLPRVKEPALLNGQEESRLRGC